jgi:NAD(P)-dependent dehydrogenase (short-subunit alcohol dehydrogenase family)
VNCAGAAAIVTGGGSGLGAATAKALARAGARVGVLDIDRSAAGKIAAECGALPAVCDVCDPASVRNALQTVAATHGRARIVVNCAGRAATGRILGRDALRDLELFRSMLDVNLVGTFNVLRLAAGDMTSLEPLEHGERGVIINTASVAALEAQAGQAAYGAAKAGVIGLTLPAARELASLGIRVMCIAPGYFDTSMLHGLLRGSPMEELLEDVPFPRRAGRPEEYAELALHLCENVMLNGEVIRLDAALRLPWRVPDKSRGDSMEGVEFVRDSGSREQ